MPAPAGVDGRAGEERPGGEADARRDARGARVAEVIDATADCQVADAAQSKPVLEVGTEVE
jgi:hypothetical protein